MKTMLVGLMILGTGAAGLMVADEAPRSQAAAEPERIQVQHILIAFSGTLPGKVVNRSQEEARKLAYDLLERARKGEDFDTLVKQHTNDSHPGIYGMSNLNVRPESGEFGRNQMVGAFGNVGFKLKVGEVGIAGFDAKSSPFGYHIIKRLK